jgi:hypothetical protein
MEKLYSVSGAARHAQCSEATVRRAAAAGIVTAQRVDGSGARLLTQIEADKLREHIRRRRQAA